MKCIQWDKCFFNGHSIINWFKIEFMNHHSYNCDTYEEFPQ